MKRFTTLKKSFLLFYLIIIFIAVACSYSAKVIEEKKLVSSISKKSKPPINRKPRTNFKTRFKNLKENPLLSCNLEFFNEMTKDEFRVMSIENFFIKDWEVFFQSNVYNVQIVKDECLRTLGVLASNGIKSTDPFVLHNLINQPQKLKSILLTSTIPNPMIIGVANEFKAVITRFNQPKIFVREKEYERSNVEQFITSFKQSLDLNGHIPTLESYEIGKEYSFCGYYNKADIYSDKKGTKTNYYFNPCSYEDRLNRFRIKEVDGEWLQLEQISAINEEYGGSTVEEFPQIDSQLIFLKIREITTPYVLTDGVMSIALSDTRISTIDLGDKGFVVTNNAYTCDSRIDYPLIGWNLKFSTNEGKFFEYPKGFNPLNARYLKNFNANNLEIEPWCGT